MRMVRNLQLGAGTDVAAKANPLLSKEGQARSAGVVCSKSRSILIDAREALLLIGAPRRHLQGAAMRGL